MEVVAISLKSEFFFQLIFPANDGEEKKVKKKNEILTHKDNVHRRKHVTFFLGFAFSMKLR